MWYDEIKKTKKPLNVNVPPNWNVHANGIGNNVFLVDPENEKIFFRIDNVPYFCTSTMLVYLTYQISSFMTVNDVEIEEVSVDSHSNVNLKIKIKCGNRCLKGELLVEEIDEDLKMIGYLAREKEKIGIEEAMKVLGL